MKVKDVILEAASVLGMDLEGIEMYINGEDDYLAKDAERLLDCFNIVENELALDYLPLYAEDELETETGRIEFAALQYAPIRIVRIINEEGRSEPYTLFPEYAKVRAGNYRVRYAYSPEKKTFDGVSDYLLNVSDRMVCYGILSEYCLGEGRFEEASLWDKKYKDAITAACRGIPCTRLRSRRWV